jgi:hypothetical protein
MSPECMACGCWKDAKKCARNKSCALVEKVTKNED